MRSREEVAALPQASYTYLLGRYLGDGYIASHPRGVYRLRICRANAYPELIERCEQAMGTIIATKVSRVACIGCTEVAACSKHWPCLFPQHGNGRKHERKIEFSPWQQELVDLDPRPLVRGRLHWRPNNPWSLSVARPGSVALLDGFVGPKR